MKITQKYVGVLLMIVTVSTSLFAQKQVMNADREIRKVVEDFRLALVNKDKPLYLSLFLDGAVSWQSVTEDKSLSRLRLKQPAETKVVVSPANSHLSFIDWIVRDKKSTVETFSDIKVITDGDVAFVGADYKFIYDGRETNRGKEFWLLVRSESGWKITSVNWSETLPK